MNQVTPRRFSWRGVLAGALTGAGWGTLVGLAISCGGGVDFWLGYPSYPDPERESSAAGMLVPSLIYHYYDGFWKVAAGLILVATVVGGLGRGLGKRAACAVHLAFLAALLAPLLGPGDWWLLRSVLPLSWGVPGLLAAAVVAAALATGVSRQQGATAGTGVTKPLSAAHLWSSCLIDENLVKRCLVAAGVLALVGSCLLSAWWGPGVLAAVVMAAALSTGDSRQGTTVRTMAARVLLAESAMLGMAGTCLFCAMLYEEYVRTGHLIYDFYGQLDEPLDRATGAALGGFFFGALVWPSPAAFRDPGAAVRSLRWWLGLACVTALAYLPGFWLAQGHPNESHCLEGHTASVTGVAISADGRSILSASDDGTLRLWSAATAQELRRYEGHRGPVKGLALSGDGRHAVSYGIDDTIRLWNLATGKEVYRFEEVAPLGVGFSPDGRRILSGNAKSFRVWDVRTGRELRSVRRADPSVQPLIFSPDGHRALGVIGVPESLGLWSVDTGETLRAFPVKERAFGAAFSPNGRRALSGWANFAELWDLETGQLLRCYEWQDWQLGPVFVTPFAFSLDGRRALTSVSNVVVLFDVETGEELRRFRGYRQGHRAWVTCVAVSPDGSWGVSGSRDTTLRIWRLPK